MYRILLSLMLIMINLTAALADCPLDHFFIGINEDGITGTEDDNKLFVDCRINYRHSDKTEQTDFLYWYYEMSLSGFVGDYVKDEPGFDYIYESGQAFLVDPNRAIDPNLTPDTDYRIMVECLSISPGLKVIKEGEGAFEITQPGESFNHSYYAKPKPPQNVINPHIHLKFRAPDNKNMYWVTFFMYDDIADGNQFEPSEPFSIVFNKRPQDGDLVIDGRVDMADLAELAYYWLKQDAGRKNDYFQRADANRNGKVDAADFSMLAANWLSSL